MTDQDFVCIAPLAEWVCDTPSPKRNLLQSFAAQKAKEDPSVSLYQLCRDMYRYWATVDIDQTHAQHDQIQAVFGNCAWVFPKPDEATASSKTRKARTGVCSPELKKR